MPSQRVKIVEGGKLVIPATFRREMGIAPGDTVIVELDEGELRARSLPSAIRRVQERMRALNPDGRLLSEELIAARRGRGGRGRRRGVGGRGRGGMREWARDGRILSGELIGDRRAEAARE